MGAALQTGLHSPPPGRNRPCRCGSGRKYKNCCETKTAQPTAVAPSAPLFAEINLERAFVGLGADMRDFVANSDPGERVVHAADVVREMDRAWAAGVRTLLVSVDSGGGQVEAGIVLYDAIDHFRAAGGHVVVFVSGLAASTASWWILAAEFVVARKGSRIIVHGRSSGLLDESTAFKRAIYTARTLAPVAMIEEWISRPADREGRNVVSLDAARASELGFADFVGGRGVAVDLAGVLSRGKSVALSSRERARSGIPECTVQLRSLSAMAQRLGPPDYETRFDALYARRQIEASVISPGQIKTSNYAEDGSGFPTAGVKLDHVGTALKVAPGNLLLGQTYLDAAWFAQSWRAFGRIEFDSAGNPALTDTVEIASIAIVGSVLRITYNAPPGAAGTSTLLRTFLHTQEGGPVRGYRLLRVAASLASHYIDVQLSDSGGTVLAWNRGVSYAFELSLFFGISAPGVYFL